MKGTFKARAIEWKLGNADTGTEQVAILFKILEGEHKDQTINGYLYFTEKSTERALQSLEYCGWDGDSLSELKGMGTQDVFIVVEEEEFNGRKRSKVQWINRVQGLALKNAMTPEEAERFNQRMRGEIMKRKKERGMAQPTRRDNAEFNYGANAKASGDKPPV